ncbi:MAG TPA: aromatic hydrocarbon degradation protein, partial [Flavisolibacter sp.]|nr:aromatic hydrocarbon degradation protein [Flavisolibacter sp.]
LEYIQNNNIRNNNLLADYYYETPFNGALAYNAYLIDTVAGGSAGNYDFQSRAANIVSTGLLQEQRIKTRGGIYEFALGLAANFNDKLMLGGSIGIPFLNYDRQSSFTEADATTNPNNQFNYAEINEEVSTKGAGFNARLGLIYKPAEYWRVGLAFHTPTIYSLTDKYQSDVTADVELPSGEVFSDYSLDYTNDAPAEFKYMLITPYRVMGSISYVLREIEDVTKQRGFLTADVEYVNYKASSFQTDDEQLATSSDEDYYKSLNRAVDNAYKGAFNFKVGGELKFTTIMFRAGAAYYGNPYKDIQGEKGHKLNLSGGLGYRDKGYYIDLTYVHSMNKDVHFPYRLQYANYEGARVNSTAGNVMLSVGFKF